MTSQPEETSPYLPRIRLAWKATEDADERLAEIGMDPFRFREIVEGRKKPSTMDVSRMSWAFRTTMKWMISLGDKHVAISVYDRNDPEHLGSPSEVCDACTDWATGNLVPVSFCAEARKTWEDN